MTKRKPKPAPASPRYAPNPANWPGRYMSSRGVTLPWLSFLGRPKMEDAAHGRS